MNRIVYNILYWLFLPKRIWMLIRSIYYDTSGTAGNSIGKNHVETKRWTLFIIGNILNEGSCIDE